MKYYTKAWAPRGHWPPYMSRSGPQQMRTT